MTTQATTQGTGTVGKARGAVLFILALAAVLSAVVAMASTMRQAEAAASNEKIVFVSTRTTGKGVSNPTGDNEIFTINPNGTGLKQLTFNEAIEYSPELSPDGKKVAYISYGAQPSNPEGEEEVYVVNTDGSGNKNLSNNGTNVGDISPDFSPDGQKIAYRSGGIQPSNPEGDVEVYVMNAADGSGNKNLSNSGGSIIDLAPDFSPDGQRIAYMSSGIQTSNPEGDYEVYVMNAQDGTGKKNLTNNGPWIGEFFPDFSPDGQRIAYTGEGVQESNPEGDGEIFVMNAQDGTGKKNLTNNSAIGNYIYDEQPDFSPDGRKITFQSEGTQASNPNGDQEVYVMSALDGSGQVNLSDNNADIPDRNPDFSSDGRKVAYETTNAQESNPEGDWEIYTVNALDGSGQKNFTNNDANDVAAKWGSG